MLKNQQINNPLLALAIVKVSASLAIVVAVVNVLRLMMSSGVVGRSRSSASCFSFQWKKKKKKKARRRSSPFSISSWLPRCRWHSAQLAFFLKWPNSREEQQQHQPTKESASFLQLVIKDGVGGRRRGWEKASEDGWREWARAKIQKFFVFICFPSVIYGSLLALLPTPGWM